MSKKNAFIFIVFLAVLGFAIYYTLPEAKVEELANQNTAKTSDQVPGPGLPARLIIPSINVDAEIIYVGLAPDGSVDVPKGPSEVAWFQLGPRPGHKGSAVITGHFGPWRTGASSVFDNLAQLKKGDQILVKDKEGLSLNFVVRESRTYGLDESPEEVFNKNDGVYLNLITCSGDWLKDKKTYTERLVVFADAVAQ